MSWIGIDLYGHGRPGFCHGFHLYHTRIDDCLIMRVRGNREIGIFLRKEMVTLPQIPVICLRETKRTNELGSAGRAENSSLRLRSARSPTPGLLPGLGKQHKALGFARRLSDDAAAGKPLKGPELQRISEAKLPERLAGSRRNRRHCPGHCRH